MKSYPHACMFYQCTIWTKQLRLLSSNHAVLLTLVVPLPTHLYIITHTLTENAHAVKQPAKLATLHNLPSGHHGCFHFSTNARCVTSRVVFSLAIFLLLFSFLQGMLKRVSILCNSLLDVGLRLKMKSNFQGLK